jgi:D-threo-aldose 1-dehydrogenase
MNSSSARSARNILHTNMLPLGFGTGGLSDRLSRTESLRLVQTAMDCGITYFDTARMYGYGRAEAILGDLTPGNRERMILTSKAGILPPNRSILRRLIGRAVGSLHDVFPETRAYLPRPEVWQPQFGVFTIPTLRASVETSLRALRTDYLDILLLHECTLADVEAPELLNFLQILQKQGKIREFGTATGMEHTINITTAHPYLTRVIQIPNNIWNMNVARLPVRPDGLTIIHSVLTGQFQALLGRLSSDDALAKQWNSMTQIDPRDRGGLARLFLAHALHFNADGVVLFFSSSPTNIQANVRLVTDSTISASQIASLDAFIKGPLAEEARRYETGF